jgi:Family of unknown function (DUF5681)
MEMAMADTASAPGRNNSDPRDDQWNYEVGYGRPPKHSRFKPGQSGNPQGRRKGTENLKTQLRDACTDLVPVRDGSKTRMVPAIVVVLRVLLNKAIKGDLRAIQLVLKNAIEWGALDQTGLEPTGCTSLTDEEIRNLSDEHLQQLIQIERTVERRRRDGPRKH